jgi:MGT family glycosyltransferase
MRILISSLQVSQGASKGHLHPAIEIGLELKRRGHQVGILPLPNTLNKEDKEQIIRCQFEMIEPPSLPKGLPLSPQELGKLAKNPETTWKAYHSFLVAPLEYQFEQVIQIIKHFNPDIIVYDLLVYAAPLAARLLGIPDLGFCAGLKLIAPPKLTTVYQNVYRELFPIINQFLEKYSLTADFHDLELLSNTFQLVFTPEKFVSDMKITLSRKTICAGSLPISTPRCEQVSSLNYPNKNFIVVCFGSVLDPANYQGITQLIIKIARQFKQHIIISTQNPQLMQAEDITAASYLPLPQLLKEASLFIHHGGANTFSESLHLGVPQILIPLTTDQPIQAEFLKASQAGIAIYPDEVTEENLYAAFKQLLDKANSLRQQIETTKKLFQKSSGAITAANLIEQSIKQSVNI